MPLILAIEPDYRQAAQIKSIARDRVDAELVLAHTTEGALDIIGDRVPDLVLVPALLSPQDDAALAAALRVIAAAAHVRTLTIPVFATAKPAAASRGVLGRWRRAKEAPAPDGCDPAVFAEQICAYLEERAAYADAMPPPVQSSVQPSKPLQPVEAAPRQLDIAPPAAIAAFEFTPRVEQRPVVEDLPIAREELQAEDVFDTDEDATPEIDLSLELDSQDPSTMLGTDSSTTLEAPSTDALWASVGEPAAVSEPVYDYDLVVVDEPIAAVAQPAAIEANEVAGWNEPIAVEPMELDSLIAVDEPAMDERAMEEPNVPKDMPIMPPPRPFEPWVPMSCGVQRLWPPIEGMLVEEDRPERTEWSALIASLRQDMERRRDTPDPEPVVRRSNRRVAKPVQDEWGFFDPEQCGFAALLAKLDEITGSHNV
jgi:hypothetical protein